MTDVYTQENASKKKFLAPVLVILLCMVSLTAAGYAYSATVDNTGDDVDIKGLTMTLKDSESHDVTAALYDLDVAYGTHNVNGKAVDFSGGYGFLAADESVAVYTAPEVPTLFKAGYYVESEIDSTPASVVEYTTAGDELTAIQNKAGLTTDALKAISSVYKIGGDYTLNIENKTGDEVAVSVSTTAANLAIKGVKLIAVFKESTTIVDTIEITNLASADQIGENIDDGVTKNYTVSLYAVSTDYYSNTADVIPAESVAFAIHFVGEVA